MVTHTSEIMIFHFELFLYGNENIAIDKIMANSNIQEELSLWKSSFRKLKFAVTKAEQPLQNMELEEKKDKDEKLIGKLIRKVILTLDIKPFRS